MCAVVRTGPPEQRRSGIPLSASYRQGEEKGVGVPETPESVGKQGAEGQNRTADTVIFRPLSI